MKKRILSILTALCLCLTLLPTAALAEDESGETNITWTTLTAESFNNTNSTNGAPYKVTTTDSGGAHHTTYYLPAGHYRLTDAVTLDNYLKITGTVILDLNGHDLTVGDAIVGKHIHVESGAHLTIQNNNSSRTGTVTAEHINVNGTLTLEGGTLQSNAAIDVSTISANAGSTITLKGGTVQSAPEGAIHLYRDGSAYATLYADGGTVEGTVENRGLITHSEGEADTTFNETVENGGTIAGGIFRGKVENAYWNGYISHTGSITGGTFYGEINNGAVNDDNNGASGKIEGGTFYGTVTTINTDIGYDAISTKGPSVVDNTDGNITNNGKFVFKTGSKIKYQGANDATDPTVANIDSLGLKGTGYVEIQSESNGATTSSYYSNSGKSISLSDTATVTFDLNGGSFGGALFPDYKTGYYAQNGGNVTDKNNGTFEVKVITGLSMPQPTAPTRAGYTFDGWCEKDDGGAFKDTAFDFTKTAITGDINLYAKWTPNTYTVTYNAGQYGSGSAETATKTHDVPLPLRDVPYTRTGYTQTGWATTDGGEKVYDLGGTYTDNAAVTLYPVWTKNSSGSSSTPTYSITAPTAANGTVKVSPRYAERGDTVTITVTPDAGYTLETLTVTDKNGNAVELKDLGNGKYSFKMPAGKVEVKATFMDDSTMLNFFTDVTADKYYYDAVLWAAKNGITGGVDETHFGPDLSCTRAQLVTFLWRAAGCPVVDYAMNFTDAGDGYYTEAVRWAASLGIVGGYGNGLFGTNDTITREQFVTILYRFAVAMGYDVSVGEDTNILSYNDAFEVSEYAVSAFQWATGAGIVQGADGNLMPQNPCTRAQIATMLYRLLGE